MSRPKTVAIDAGRHPISPVAIASAAKPGEAGRHPISPVNERGPERAGVEA